MSELLKCPVADVKVLDTYDGNDRGQLVGLLPFLDTPHLSGVCIDV